MPGRPLVQLYRRRHRRRHHRHHHYSGKMATSPSSSPPYRDAFPPVSHRSRPDLRTPRSSLLGTYKTPSQITNARMRIGGGKVNAVVAHDEYLGIATNAQMRRVRPRRTFVEGSGTYHRTGGDGTCTEAPYDSASTICRATLKRQTFPYYAGYVRQGIFAYTTPKRAAPYHRCIAGNLDRAQPSSLCTYRQTRCRGMTR